MTSRHRSRAVLAVLTLVIAACMGVVAAGPASAAPAGAPAAARDPNLIPLKLSPKPVLEPKVAGNGQAVVYDNCGTVRANLKNYAKKYAARHIHQVSCVTITHGATKGTVKTTAHAPALEGPMATSSLCTQSSNGTWIYDRFDECEQGGSIVETVIDANTGNVTGTADFTINQDILLQPTSTIYTENDSITVVSATGTANVPGTVFFDAGCGSPCGVLSGGQYTASLTPTPRGDHQQHRLRVRGHTHDAGTRPVHECLRLPVLRTHRDSRGSRDMGQ